MDKVEEEYERDLASIDHSGPHSIGEEQKHLNRQVFAASRDIMPIDDIHKLSDADLIYRFLIARKWVVDEAVKNIHEYVEFRKEHHLNEILWENFPPEVTPLKCKFQGFDKFGHPVFYDTPEPKLISNVLQKVPRLTLLHAHFATMEESRRWQKAYGTDRVSCVYDLSNLSMAIVTNPKAIGFFKEVAKLDQHFYPENMRTALLCNGGWAFNSLYKMLKPLLDVRVQQKLQFVNNASQMAAWIELDQIPVSYPGGRCTSKDTVLVEDYGTIARGSPPTRRTSRPSCGSSSLSGSFGKTKNASMHSRPSSAPTHSEHHDPTPIDTSLSTEEGDQPVTNHSMSSNRSRNGIPAPEVLKSPTATSSSGKKLNGRPALHIKTTSTPPQSPLTREPSREMVSDELEADDEKLSFRSIPSDGEESNTPTHASSINAADPETPVRTSPTTLYKLKRFNIGETTPPRRRTELFDVRLDSLQLFAPRLQPTSRLVPSPHHAAAHHSASPSHLQPPVNGALSSAGSLSPHKERPAGSFGSQLDTLVESPVSLSGGTVGLHSTTFRTPSGAIDMVLRCNSVSGPKIFEGYIYGKLFCSSTGHSIVDGNRVLRAEIISESSHVIHPHVIVVDDRKTPHYICRRRRLHKEIEIYQPQEGCYVSLEKKMQVSLSGARVLTHTCRLTEGPGNHGDWTVVLKKDPLKAVQAIKGGDTIRFQRTFVPDVGCDPFILFALVMTLDYLWEE